MNLMNSTHAGIGGAAPWMMPPEFNGPIEAPALKEIAVELLSIRRLQGAEINRIAKFRGEIDLKAAAAADPEFMTREKKETSWG